MKMKNVLFCAISGRNLKFYVTGLSSLFVLLKVLCDRYNFLNTIRCCNDGKIAEYPPEFRYTLYLIWSGILVCL